MHTYQIKFPKPIRVTRLISRTDHLLHYDRFLYECGQKISCLQSLVFQAKTKAIKRCCLIHYDAEEGLFDFRHYAIQVVPVGLSKAVKKFNKRKLPDLSNFTDVSEFMTK